MLKFIPHKDLYHLLKNGATPMTSLLGTGIELTDEIGRSLYNYHVEPDRPIMAYLYITGRCNLRCSFCEIGSSKDDEELSFREWRDIIRQLAAWKVPKVYITGGEPFFRRDILDLISEITRSGIRVTRLTTNGTLLHTLKSEDWNLLRRGLGAIFISLDSPGAEVHNALRGGGGVYEKVLYFLRNRKREAMPPIFLAFVVTRQNYRTIPEMIRLSYLFDIPHIQFQPVNFMSNLPNLMAVKNKESFLLRPEEKEGLEKALDEGLQLSFGLGISTNLPILSTWISQYFFANTGDTPFYKRIVERFLCSKPFNYIHINYNGDLIPCTLLTSMGNIREGSLRDLWRRGVTELKDRRLLKGRLFPLCRSCYCDFPSNLRESLLYFPIENRRYLFKLFPYYLGRAMGGF